MRSLPVAALVVLFTALLGAPAARARADALYADALAALEPLGADADPLRWMAAYIVHRDR
jgi:hypothetical protein